MNSNPVTQVRKAARLLQKQFAKRLGVSEQLIKNVEAGLKPLTIETAAKIQYECGATRKSLMGCGTALAVLTGKSYVPEDFTTWQQAMKLSEPELEIVIMNSAARVRDLLIAGNRRERLPAILCLIEEAIFHAVKHCNLEPALNGIHRERKEEYAGDLVKAFTEQSMAPAGQMPPFVAMLESTSHEIFRILKERKNKLERLARAGSKSPTGVAEILKARETAKLAKAAEEAKAKAAAQTEEKKRLAEKVKKFRSGVPRRQGK